MKPRYVYLMRVKSGGGGGEGDVDLVHNPVKQRPVESLCQGIPRSHRLQWEQG